MAAAARAPAASGGRALLDCEPLPPAHEVLKRLESMVSG